MTTLQLNNEVEMPAGKSGPGGGAQPEQEPPVATASAEAVQLFIPTIPRKYGFQLRSDPTLTPEAVAGIPLPT